MFAGQFGQHVISAPHPLIVVEGEKVLGSFSTLEAAEKFIARQRRASALFLYTLARNGHAEDPLAGSLLHNSKSGSSREDGIQSPGFGT